MEYRQFKETEKGLERIKENDLPGHLENQESKKISKTVKNDEVRSLLAKDYQLNEAFNLLKGLVLFHKG